MIDAAIASADNDALATVTLVVVFVFANYYVNYTLTGISLMMVSLDFEVASGNVWHLRMQLDF